MSQKYKSGHLILGISTPAGREPEQSALIFLFIYFVKAELKREREREGGGRQLD